jgi:hypothetical protein
MTDLRTVYERQQDAREARTEVSVAYEDIYWSLDARARERVNVYEHPTVIAAQAKADRLIAEVAALREEVGGRVFRVVDSKMAELRERITKLNKKAVKLGTGEITLTVSDEKDQEVRREMRPATDSVSAALLAVEGTTRDYVERVIDFTFITVNGETPQIGGWVFLATLDHDADQGADESVGIRRAPVGTFLKNKIGEEAAAAVEAADLTSYRHAGPDCDHCGFNRRRKQTYILFEVATGELRQIGSTCLGDYTGAHNPERVAAWAEWLEALYADLGFESGDDGFGDVGIGGGRIAIPTRDFLTNVAAMIREFGWTPRWTRDDSYGDFTRNYGATADRAKDNYLERNAKLRVATTDEDREIATTALDWVRDDLSERDELSEFEHNLTTYCRADYLGEKGDGFVASAIGAYQRELQRQLEAKRTAGSEWIGSVGDRIKGLTFTVTFVKSFEGQYGTRWLTKGYDRDGNGIIWWGAGGIDQGTTVTCSATIKKHETDSYNGGGKVTQVTNLRSITVVEADAEATEIEVTKTAAEREQDRLRRLDPTMLDEQIDAARASYNDYNDSLSHADSGDWKRYYQEQIDRLTRLINRLEADQAKLKELQTTTQGEEGM